jgi:hypothetical protein
MEALQQFEEMARREFDGHYCIFRFTNGYKAGFGTLDVDSGDGRGHLRRMKNFKTLDEALNHAIEKKLCLWEF